MDTNDWGGSGFLKQSKKSRIFLLREFGGCGIYVAIVNEAEGLENGIVQTAKLGSLKHASLKFFKIRFPEIEFCSNFDHKSTSCPAVESVSLKT